MKTTSAQNVVEQSELDAALLAGVANEFRIYHSSSIIYGRDGGSLCLHREARANKSRRDESFVNLCGYVQQLLLRGYSKSQISGPLTLDPQAEKALDIIVETETAFLTAQPCPKKRKTSVCNEGRHAELLPQ